MKVRLRVAEVAQEKQINMTRLGMLSLTTPDTMVRYWHDRVNAVDLRVLARIAKVLGVKPTELLEDVNEEEGVTA